MEDFVYSLQRGEPIPEMGMHMTAVVQQFLVDAGDTYAVAIPGLMELWNRYGKQSLMVDSWTRQGWLVDDHMVINCMVPEVKRYFSGDLRTQKLGAAFFRMLHFQQFAAYDPRIPMTNQKDLDLFIHCYQKVFNATVPTLLPHESNRATTRQNIRRRKVHNKASSWEVDQ